MKRFPFILISLLLAAVVARAQAPATTTIGDVVYRADGTPAGGTLLITWPAFESAGGKAVAAGSKSVTLGAGGVVNVALVPNEGANPAGTYYKVVYKLDDGSTSQELWSVPNVPTTTIAAIRSTLVPSGVAIQVASRQYVDSQIAALTGARFHNVRYCDSFGGADAGAKIAACIADLPAAGGTADARGLEGAQTIAADIFSSVTKPVHLSLGAATYTLSASTTIPANITIQFSRGGSFSIATGTTTVIRGPLQAPVAHVFTLNGSGTVSFLNGRVREFHPEWWGAAGDGKVLNDGSISASSSTLTSASAAFTSSDVGKPISVEGAGASGIALNTTIATFVSTTSVTLSAAASTTVSSAKVYFGTDDSTEIQAALDAASSSLGGKVIAPATSVITSAVTLKSGGVTLEGQGSGSVAALTTFGFRGSRLLVLGGIYGVVVSDSTTQVQHGFGVRNLTIVGTSLGKAGLRMGSTSSDVNNQFGSAHVEDVEIEGFTSATVAHDVPTGEPAASGGAGIFITRGVDVLFERVKSRKNLRGLLESSDHSATTYTFVRSNFRENTNAGVELRDSISFSFRDSIFESNGAEGLLVKPTVSGAFVNNLRVAGCYFEDNIKTSGTHEIVLDGQAAGTGIYNFSFADCNLNVGTVSGAKGLKAMGAGVEYGFLSNVVLASAANTNIETVSTSGKIVVFDGPADSNPAHGPNVLDTGTTLIQQDAGRYVVSPAGSISEQRVGAASQQFRIFHTYTNDSNHERARISFDGTGRAVFGRDSAGSGADKSVVVEANGNLPVVFRTNGSDRVQVAGTGDLAAIGTSGLTNWAYFTSDASDPADSGSIRLGNGQLACWESSPAGTDTCLQADTNEDFVFGAGTAGNDLAWFSGTAFRATLSHANTANRVYSFPDTATTIAGLSVAQAFIEHQSLDNQKELRLRELDAGGDEYLGLRARAAITTSRTLTLNLPESGNCAGTNGGALTILSDEIVCSDDDGGAGGSGDAIEIEQGDNAGTFDSIDTTARFDDAGDINFAFTDGGAGGPDTVTATVRADSVALTTDTTGNYVASLSSGAGLTGFPAAGEGATGTPALSYSDTLAGDPAMNAEECRFATDGTGGGLICEGTTADANEGLVVFPFTGADKTITFFDSTDTVVGRSTSDTLANKVLNNTNSFSGFTDWTAIAAPATPAAGIGRLYFKTTNKMFCGKDDAGVETCMDAGAGGSTSWSGLTPPSAAVSMVSDAAAETETHDFQGNFASGSQFLIKSSGNPTSGVLFEVQSNDIDISPIAQITSIVNSTTQAVALLVDRANPVAAGINDGNLVCLRGASFDSDANDRDFCEYVDVTSNAGAGRLSWQTRQDGGAFTNLMVLEHTGYMGLGTGASALMGGLNVSDGSAPESSAVISDTEQSVIRVFGNGQARVLGRDVTNDIEFVMGTSASGAAVAGSLTAHDFWLRTANTNRLEIINSTANVNIVSGALQFAGTTVITSGRAANNLALDAEATGNSLGTVGVVWIDGAGCNNTTALENWDSLGSGQAVSTCNLGTNTAQGVLRFATDSGSLTKQRKFLLPHDWNSGGNVDVRVKWKTAAIVNDVMWQIAIACVGDGETDDPSFTDDVFTADTAKGTANQQNDTVVNTVTTTGSCAASELAYVRIKRDPAHASDTLAAGTNADLIGLEIRYRRTQ